ncbi:MAG TPA: RNA polymerase sigma factor [Steroidobacteraceae bacterium]|jgi:RNA polymerase sigma-70 factor (ECF subfamily)
MTGLTNGSLLLPPLPRVSTNSARDGIRAFEAIYREHVGAVYGLCLRLTGSRELAEDCTQEAFLAAWRALPQFQARSTLATWLHRIALNTVLARRRSPAARFEAAETADEESLQRLGGSDTAPPLDLERAIAALPEGARHVLVLVGLYGYNHEEAAQLLGLVAGTCRAHLHRARQLLKQHMGLTENP